LNIAQEDQSKEEEKKTRYIYKNRNKSSRPGHLLLIKIQAPLDMDEPIFRTFGSMLGS
jgi:hypothetical protein